MTASSAHHLPAKSTIRSFGRKVMVLAAMFALAACHAADRTPDADILHVGSQRGSTKAVMLASGALEGAPYKVEWAEFAAAQPLLEAVGAGAIDVGIAGDAPFMFAYQSGSPIKAIGIQYVQTRPVAALALLVPGNSPARNLVDLKGKIIATTRGSVGHYLVIRALQEAKLPADWVKLTFLPPGDAKAAFSSGSIDGWSTWVPYVRPALDTGARIVVDGRTLVRGYGLDVANDAAIGSKRALLADFLDREAKALDWARRNPEPYAAVLARETGLPIDIARDFAVKNARTAARIDDAVVADLQQVVDTFQRSGAAQAERPVPDAFDRSFSAARPIATR